MSTLVRHCSGDLRRRGGLYGGTGLVDAGLFLSLAPCVDMYCPPLKRARVSAPIVVRGAQKPPLCQPKRPCSLDTLPDECVYEILRLLPGKQERSLAACVSKRWLMLLSSIRSSEADERHPKRPLPDLNEEVVVIDDVAGAEGVQEPSRCLEGKDATDTRLASMAIKGGAGLGKLSIRSSNTTACSVTNLGLRAVARCCPSLKALMVLNAPLVGDDGLAEVADGCPLLEKLDLCQCPLISDKGLVAIAENCPNLASVTVESCNKISNKGLQAIGSLCPRLQVVSISNCPMVGDQGIAGLISSASSSSSSSSLRKIKLQNLNITDACIAVIGYYGREVTDLVFNGLQNVGERGFWVMGNTNGLKKLTNFSITSCNGLTDLGLEAVAKGSPGLKQLCLRKCGSISDAGLKSFAAAAGSLESLRLQECDRITLVGLLAALLCCADKLTSLTLARCKGIRDVGSFPATLPSCNSLRSLSVRNCPGFGSASIAMITKICPQLQNIDLRCLADVRDDGLLPLIESGVPRLIKLRLSGCSNLTDAMASAITRTHGSTLDTLGLEGCKKISDATLVAILENCMVLGDLDVSESAVTDRGVVALSSARQLKLRVLSLSRCSKVTSRSLPALGNLGKDLVGLNLQRCSSVSTTAIDALEEMMWWCDILS